MLRETKFRGKRLHGKGWIVGNLFIPNTLVAGIHICPNTSFFDFYPGLEDDCSNMNEVKNHGIALGHFHEVIPESVGQFTGLKDKNGVDIFEGDVLTYDYSDHIEIKDWMLKPHYIVKYDNENHYLLGGFGIKNNTYAHLFRFKYCEIIGNIHENLELLSKEVEHA